MFGLSFTEIIFAMVVSFLIFGPEQFPIMLKKAIQQISQLKRYISQAQNSFHDFTRDMENEFNPNQWANSDSVSQDGSDTNTTAEISYADELSINPNEYASTPLDNWRWQSQPEGKPGDFEQEPFDWKAPKEQTV